MSDDNNLIEFPKDRIKKKKKVRTTKVSYKKSQALGLSLVTTLALTLYFSAQGDLTHMSSTSSGRHPASVELRDVEIEKRIVKSIRENNYRGPASLGRNPSLEDELRLGALAGKYRIRFHDGKVAEISLIEGGPLAPEAIFLDDRLSFFHRYSSIIGPDHDRVEIASDVGPSITQETYLFQKDNDRVGAAYVELDPSGRFRSMKVQFN